VRFSWIIAKTASWISHCFGWIPTCRPHLTRAITGGATRSYR
jgi:hypothetical protein